MVSISSANMLKKTKIVATISDLRCDVPFIRALYVNGMDVVRMNTAHQSIKETLKVIRNVREVSDKIAPLIDTKGPEIRTTQSDHKVALKKGDIIRIAGDASRNSTPDCIFVTYNNFANEIEPGKKVLFDDGDIELEVVERKDGMLVCHANDDGIIKGRKSVNVPGVHFNLPALNERDREYINFAIDQDIDFIAHSFVRCKEDVMVIQQILPRPEFVDLHTV